MFSVWLFLGGLGITCFVYRCVFTVGLSLIWRLPQRKCLIHKAMLVINNDD